MEEKEVIEQEPISNEEINSTNKPNKFINGLSSIAKKTGKGIASGVKNVYSKVEVAVNKNNEHQRLNNLFEKEALRFVVATNEINNGNVKNAKTFYAIKNMSTCSLLIRQKDNFLTAGTILYSDEGAFQIADIDSKTEIDFPNDSSSQFPIKCYKCIYKLYEKPAQPNIINNSESVIVNGIVNGDINQSIVVKNLDNIETAIKAAKPSLFNKITNKNKNEAIEMYGNFKDCIINQKKDETLFDKFIKILNIVAPAAVKLAITLINGI